MNAITTESITKIGHQIADNIIYHPTTITYIQGLLKPYAEAIETAQDTSSIEQWVPLAFPAGLAAEALTKMRASSVENSDIVNTAKTSVIESIVSEILETAANDGISSNATIVLPWDVQTGISNDEELSRVTGITIDNKTLPVTITLRNKFFTHSLTKEFTLGLLLFSLRTNFDFQVTISNTPFTTDYIVDNNQLNKYSGYTLHDQDSMRNFTVNIKDITYTFDTPDLMQGFATGAMWAGVDHHDYWSELTQFNKDENRQIHIMF
jgi:hypothetical protein